MFVVSAYLMNTRNNNLAPLDASAWAYSLFVYHLLMKRGFESNSFGVPIIFLSLSSYSRRDPTDDNTGPVVDIPETGDMAP